MPKNNFYMCVNMVQLIYHVCYTVLSNCELFFVFPPYFCDLFLFCPFFGPKNGDAIYFENNNNFYMCASMVQLIYHVCCTVLSNCELFFHVSALFFAIYSYFAPFWGPKMVTRYILKTTIIFTCARVWCN